MNTLLTCCVNQVNNLTNFRLDVHKWTLSQNNCSSTFWTKSCSLADQIYCSYPIQMSHSSLLLWKPTYLNTLRPRQNDRHFPDDIFKRIFLNENVRILIWFSLKFVPKCPINNIPTLFHITAWRRPSNKPLSEPMVVSLLTHVYVTRSQWVNCYIINDKIFKTVVFKQIYEHFAGIKSRYVRESIRL